MKLKAGLSDLENTVKQHPLLEIFEVEYSSGVDPEKFDVFKKQYALDVPQAIKEAYSEINGFTITYGLKNNTDEGLAQFNSVSKDYMLEKGPPYIIGSIKFLTFEKCFLENTWENTLFNTGSESDKDDFTFKKKNYTYNDFGKQLKPFDLFSEETCAAFILIPDERFDAMLLTDHYADWSNSRIISFDDYWKLVLSTKGIVDARERYLSETDGSQLKRMNTDAIENITPEVFSPSRA
jgi:hypothetical protein